MQSFSISLRTKFLAVLALFLFLLAPDVVFAQTNFITCNGVDCSACNLAEMANIIIKWLIGMLFLVFAILMLRAGFNLLTSAGNPGALSAAKDSFKNALIGLLIVLAAWLVVDTLMRGLLGNNGVLSGGVITGYGPWAQVQCQVQARTWPGDPATDPTMATSGPMVPSGPAPAGCTGGTCQALPPDICKAANSCTISPDLASRVTAFHTAVVDAGVGGTRITEAYPPTVRHQSQCHENGTCIDYGRIGGLTGSEINTVAAAAIANNLRPVYEVKTAAERDALVSQGANAQYIKVIPQITAPHFSVYGY